MDPGSEAKGGTQPEDAAPSGRPVFDQRGQSVGTQTNVAGDNMRAGRDVIQVAGNLIQTKPEGAERSKRRKILWSVSVAVTLSLSFSLALTFGFDWQGDITQGDKVTGDKVLGDKITINPPPSPPEVTFVRQVPAPPQVFVGRDQEIAAAIAAIEGPGRGVVIAGMGGVGTEEVARVVADRIKDGYPDGHIFLTTNHTNHTN